MSAKIKKIEDGVTAKLDELSGRVKGLSGYLNTVVYKQYQDAQVKRWETENASEGRRWDPLTPLYLQRKEVKYAGFPYAGRRIGIATGALIQSVVGSDQRYHRKIVTPNQLIIGTRIKYASHFAEKRPIFQFGKPTTKRILDGIRAYLRGGK